MSRSSPIESFVGRAAELSRLADALPTVRLALVLGLGGMGKSALVDEFARSWRGPVVRHEIGRGRTASETLDELGAAAGLDGSASPALDDLALAFDRTGALVILEDAHRFDGEGRALLADLLARISTARVIATARSHVFRQGEGPERLQLVMGGLDLASARALWSRLDLLYGPSDGFEDAWRRSHGNPCYLRRAHAGDHRPDLLLSETVAGLVGDDRAAAVALCLADVAPGSPVAMALLPDGRGAAALGRLHDVLAVETRGGAVHVHPAIRAAVLHVASPAEIQEGHRLMAEAMADAGLEPIVEIRGRLRHLIGSGQRAAARAMVLGRAAELIRSGATGELVGLLDAVVTDDDVEARVSRARVLARMLDIRPAYDELARLSSSRETTSDRVRTAFAHVAMLSGRFDVAERIARVELASQLDVPLRVRAATVWLLTRTYQGHGEAARAWIRCTAELEDTVSRGQVELMCAFSCWLEQRDAEAEEGMRAATALLGSEPSVRARVLRPLFSVMAMALAGRIDEASVALAEADADLGNFDEPLIAVKRRALQGTVQESRGDFAAALGDISVAERRWANGGQVMGAMWAQLRRGRLLLCVGQAREGHGVLDDVTRQAVAAGAQLIARQAEEARLADPRRAVRAPRGAPPTCPGEIRRERVLAALRALGAGHLQLARGHVARASVDQALDPLERALLALAVAALARATGDEDPDGGLDRAIQLAAEAGADPEIVADLDAWLREAARSAGRATPIAIDRARHAIQTAGTQVVALSSRPTLRRLFYALFDARGASVDKASLAMAIWRGKYRPDRHDSALWVNLKRLRDLLAGTGLRIVTEPTGYSLIAESGFRLVG